jgi:hypothetical protein
MFPLTRSDLIPCTILNKDHSLDLLLVFKFCFSSYSRLASRIRLVHKSFHPAARLVALSGARKVRLSVCIYLY